MKFLYEVNFETFRKRVNELEDREAGTLERIHYLEKDEMFHIYYENYYTKLPYASILNSGEWDSVENFKMSFLTKAIEIITTIKESSNVTLKVQNE